MAGPNPILSGLAGRCPNCGDGHLFEGFLRVSPRCEACGFDLAKADSGDGPAVFVILIAVGVPILLIFTFSEAESRDRPAIGDIDHDMPKPCVLQPDCSLKNKKQILIILIFPF